MSSSGSKKRSRSSADGGVCPSSTEPNPFERSQESCADEMNHKTRLEQFNRYFEGVLAEKEELRRKLLLLRKKLEEIDKNTIELTHNFNTNLDARDKLIKTLRRDADEQMEVLTERHQMQIKNLESEIQSLKEQAEEFETTKTELEYAKQKEVEAIHLKVVSLTGTIRAAQAAFVDSITLEQNATCVPLSSGQFTNLEGLVKIWAHDDNFNGDVWFPFQCPLTKTTTAPVKDVGEESCPALFASSAHTSSLPQPSSTSWPAWPWAWAWMRPRPSSSATARPSRTIGSRTACRSRSCSSASWSWPTTATNLR
jgi:hypothetical protein